MASKCLRVLELYSGVGGMHYALKETELSFKVVQAIDVNTNANEIYRLNFKDTAISSCGIEGLTVKSLDKLDIDMILMSPPCQPFTRIGKKQDTQDPRSRSFLHLLDLIPSLKRYPSYILLENVKGFEESETRQRLKEMLDRCNYVYQEFLLTPLQFGVPNSRLRYYLIAKQFPAKFAFKKTEEVMEKIPDVATDWLRYKHLAETTQKQCVCGGYYGDSGRISSSTEENSSASKPQANMMEERLVEEIACIQNVEKSQVESKIPATDHIPGVISEPNYSHMCACSDKFSNESGSSDNHSETHTCVKRFKTEDKKQMIFCNNRKRQAGICDKNNDFKQPYTNDGILEQVVNASTDAKHDESCLENFGFNMRQEQVQEKLTPCLSLSHFLEDSRDMDYFKQYLLPDSMLQHFIVMDIINPCSRKSTCFTKGYGKFVTGTGSVVQMAKDIQLLKESSLLKDKAVSDRDHVQWSETELSVIRSLQLRYFTPREVANILCFPKSFCFPSGLTSRQLYMLLGNSLNVHVVSVLIRLMVADDTNIT